MAAANAALNTCELLENIISYLPCVQITRVTRVCQTWKKVILESQRLHHLRVLSPKLDYPKVDWRVSELYDLTSVDCGLKTNNSLGTEEHAWNKTWQRVGEEAHHLSGCDHEVVLPKDIENLRSDQIAAFATFPPCQAVNIMVWDDSPNAVGRSAVEAVVYVRDGVRIRDVFTAIQAVAETRDLWSGRPQSTSIRGSISFETLLNVLTVEQYAEGKRRVSKEAFEM